MHLQFWLCPFSYTFCMATYCLFYSGNKLFFRKCDFCIIFQRIILFKELLWPVFGLILFYTTYTLHTYKQNGLTNKMHNSYFLNILLSDDSVRCEVLTKKCMDHISTHYFFICTADLQPQLLYHSVTIHRGAIDSFRGYQLCCSMFLISNCTNSQQNKDACHLHLPLIF